MRQSLRQSQIFQALFTYRKVEELEQFLNKNPNINFMAINDMQGNNVLHQLAYEGHLDLIKIYVHEAKKCIYRKRAQPGSERKTLDREFDDWLNKRNNEGFTPLLYASYSGNMDVIRYLVQQHRVNQQAKTSNGLNALHLASQKNMVSPFIYFRDRINLDDVDDLNSTPLHWAAYVNSQEVVSFILSITSIQSLNRRDSQGNTPLMLAVTYGNTRIVRRLLIKGANRYIRNSEGKLPIDIARESQFKTITKMLNEDYSCFDFVKFYCNIKIQYKPKRRKYIIPLLFIIGFIINVSIVNIFIKFSDEFHFYGEIFIFGAMFLLYLSLLLPLPKHQTRQLSQLLSEYNEKKIKKACFQCVNLVPKRGYHCDICRVCVRQYDHHCTWINNCVGKKNLGRFIFFLLFLLASLALIGSVVVMSSIIIVTDDLQKFHEWFTLRYQWTDNLQKFCLLGSFLFCEVTSLFFFPVLTLFIVQIKNLFTNQTTFQKSRGPVTQQSDYKKRMRQKKVSLRNCRVMCTDFRGSFISGRSSFTEVLSGDKMSQDLLTADKYSSQAAEITKSTH